MPLLHRDGHTLAIFHRGVRNGGVRSAELPADILSLRGDRHRLEAHAPELRRFAPDMVIDMIASSGAHGSALVRTFRGVAQRVVVLSSIDVYHAAAVFHGLEPGPLEPGPLEPLPLREGSALRPSTATYPLQQLRMLQSIFGWLDEGYDKIAVERAVQGDPSLRATILRLPMVYGPGDPLHRFWPLVKRVQDGRPAILFEECVARWRSPRGTCGIADGAGASAPFNYGAEDVALSSVRILDS